MPTLDFTGAPPKKYTELQMQAKVAEAIAAERERVIAIVRYHQDAHSGDCLPADLLDGQP